MNPQLPTRRPVHPWIFMVLILPFGIMGGYLTVTVGYVLKEAGASVEQVAGLIALSMIPHAWKFLWAPIADIALRRKTMYWMACVLSAASLWWMGVLSTPSRLTELSVVVVLANVVVTFLGMSVESLMAYETPDDEKGRAGGWFQAGNLGGGGLGGGAGLWLAQYLPSRQWVAGAALGVVCLACCSALLFIEEPAAAHRQASLGTRLWQVLVDLWKTGKSRIGAIALILCFLPIGSGAASNLWSPIAGDWHASAHTVELVTGVLGGLVSALGCVAGGWLCDRMDRKAAYVLYGILQALCAVAMALAPRTEAMYIVFTMAYAFITGLTYAGFSAFVLEAMGLGAAATKYNLFASLANMPIAYMTWLDGKAHHRGGAAGMLYTEAAAGVIGLILFLGVLVVWPPRKRQERAS